MKTILILALSLLTLGIVGCASHNLDLTHNAPAMCELHHTHMSKTNVPIDYGLVRFSDYGEAMMAAASNSFPHADTKILGGCIVDEMRTQAVVYVCAKCEAARQTWEFDHRELSYVRPEAAIGQWIGFSTDYRENIFKLELKADHTGSLSEAVTGEMMHYEISRWETGFRKITCTFIQTNLYGPQKMTCSVGNALDATLQNKDSGWKETIRFFRADKFDEKLQLLGK